MRAEQNRAPVINNTMAYSCLYLLQHLNRIPKLPEFNISVYTKLLAICLVWNQIPFGSILKLIWEQSMWERKPHNNLNLKQQVFE